MRILLNLILCISASSCIDLQSAEQILKIKAGERNYSGATYTWKSGTVTIAEPSIQSYAAEMKAPGTFKDEFAQRDSWPNWQKGHKPIELKPDTRSIDHTLMLGLMYKSIVAESVKITSADGTVFKRNVDYKVNTKWGQVIGIGNALGTEGKTTVNVTFQYRMQRIDLVQVDKKGKISVKPGKESILCPVLPEADKDKCPIAGIYLPPFVPEAGSSYNLTDENVYMINPVSEQPVLNKQYVSKSKALLISGKPIKIALLGDSVTLGAEAGFWWSDRSKTFTGRFISGLKNLYTKAQITEIPAYKGGITTKAGADFFKKNVAPAQPDLLLIALGLNDASGSLEKGSKVPAPAFKAAILKMVQAAKASGCEVILVTPFRGNPFLDTAQLITEHRRVLIEIANEEQVACADVQTAWDQLAQRGIAPCSQVHNWSNHPGEFGHSVYSDCILGLFQE